MHGKDEQKEFATLWKQHVKQKEERKARLKKNAELNKQFIDKMEEKKVETRKRKQKEEARENLKKTGEYVSASDSDAEGAL